MSSRGKKKTTMAKLSRESRLRERRQEKAAKKDARRYAAENPPAAGDDTDFTGDDIDLAGDGTEFSPRPVAAGDPDSA